ncbi:MAG: 50S ribosomal protein L4 [Patescibacteria group bacterium]
MAELKLYSLEGKEIGILPVTDSLFAVEPKESVIHQAILAQEANSRVAIAHTKDRSEVSGGGKKPWKQKGTGRARHGSTRSPIWIGGGVAHGPRNDRNFTIKINKKAKRTALAMAITDKVKDGAFIAVENFDISEAKTKFAAKMRKALPGADKSTLVILTTGDAVMRRALKNIPKTQSIYAHSLNVRDVAKYRNVIASQAAIQVMAETFSA